jgi:hypothetical protein
MFFLKISVAEGEIKKITDRLEVVVLVINVLYCHNSFPVYGLTTGSIDYTQRYIMPCIISGLIGRGVWFIQGDYTNNMNIYELLATSKVRVYKQVVSNYIALLLLFVHIHLILICIFMKRINLLLKKA